MMDYPIKIRNFCPFDNTITIISIKIMSFLSFSGKSYSISSALDVIYFCKFNIVFIFLTDGLFILLFSCTGEISLFKIKYLIIRNFKTCIYVSLQNRLQNMWLKQLIITYSSRTPIWLFHLDNNEHRINFLNFIVTIKVTRINILAFGEKQWDFNVLYLKR